MKDRKAASGRPPKRPSATTRIGAMPRPRLVDIAELSAAERESVRRQGRNPADFEVAVYVVQTSRGEQRKRVVQRKGIGALVRRQERARRSRAQRLDTSRQPKSAAPAAERGSPRPQRAPKARRKSRPASARRRATERGDPSSRRSDDDPPLGVVPLRRFRCDVARWLAGGAA